MKYSQSYARAFCEEKNVESFNEYRGAFDREKINYRTVSNFKNCLLIAGYLFDECNADLIPEEDRAFFADKRKEFQDEIEFAPDDAFLIEKNIEYFYRTFKRIDSINEKAYKLAMQIADAFLDKLYRKKHGEPDTFGKWCHTGYKSAYRHALKCTDETDKDYFLDFKKLVDKRQINYGSLDNYKRCILFAGALFDELNLYLLPPWHFTIAEKRRTELWNYIDFTKDNLALIDYLIELFYKTFARVDPDNEPEYLKAKEYCGRVLSSFKR